MTPASPSPPGAVSAPGAPGVGPGAVLGHRYLIGPAIAAGAVGRVYEADDQLLGRRVAVKVLRSEVTGNPVARERFRREARAAAALSHPHVVAVYDFGEDDGVPFLVMEHVAGDNLSRRAGRRGGPLSLGEALRIGLGVVEGLAHAHSRGLVHRDIKAANVLLAPDGTPKLTDFGIARLLDDPGVTATGTVIGTPAYLAPELATGSPASPASDLYSYGCLLFELIAGTPPFTDPDPVVVVARHLHAPVPALPDVPPTLDRLVRSLLAKRPEDRPADAAAVVRTLRAVVGATADRPAPPVVAASLSAADVDETAPLATRTAVLQPSPVAAVGTRRRLAILAAVAVVFCLLFLALGFFLARAAFPSPRQVPRLEGLSLLEAREVADASGFTVEVLPEQVPSRVYRAGSVSDQSPPPGLPGLPGSAISVRLSSGMPRVAVPPLVGLTVAEAKQELAAVGLRLGDVRVGYDVAHPDVGEVFTSDPPAGALVVEGFTVLVTRNRTAEEWIEPVRELLG